MTPEAGPVLGMVSCHKDREQVEGVAYWRTTETQAGRTCLQHEEEGRYSQTLYGESTNDEPRSTTPLGANGLYK